MIADVTKSLREEELQAWQRIVRVLSHEINNSLAPIKSLAGSLQVMVERGVTGSDGSEASDDMQRGLGIIASRADALSRFMSAYARLARLPAPQRTQVRVEELVRRVAAIEQRLAVRVAPGPDITMHADRDQLEQALINLVRNAVDAALETGGSVDVTWRLDGARVELVVRDEGLGLPATANLLVPSTSPPSRRARGSGSSSRDRSPRRTAGCCRWRTGVTCAGAWPCCRSRWQRARSSIAPRTACRGGPHRRPATHSDAGSAAPTTPCGICTKALGT